MLYVFAIYDIKAKFYDRAILTYRSVGEALRDTVTMASDTDKKTRYSMYPEDFELHMVATFDDVTGSLQNITPSKTILGRFSDLMAPSLTTEINQ